MWSNPGLKKARRKCIAFRYLVSPTDVAYDVLDTLANTALEIQEDLELLGIDFVDAFWNIPLAAAERKYFVGTLQG